MDMASRVAAGIALLAYAALCLYMVGSMIREEYLWQEVVAVIAAVLFFSGPVAMVWVIMR